jgi:tripartite ATP-independent transporter DctM subunit
MNPLIVGIIFIFLFLILLFLRVPIAYAMLAVGFFGVAVLTRFSTAFNLVTMNFYSEFSKYTMIVVPMYVWMGFLAYESGIGSRLYNFADKLLGHLPGGLAMATQAASALFGAICGSTTATAATMGAIAIPEMNKYKYDVSLSTASVAAGGVLGILIPPSVVFIVYGIATEQSISKLFKAGIIPGILLTLLYILAIYILTLRNPDIAPKGEKSTFQEKIKALRGGLWEVILIFSFSLGGMFAGWFTPSEAGSIGAGGVLLITILEKSLSWEGFKKSLVKTTETVAMIMLLLVGATVFGRFLALSTIPFKLAEWAGNLPLPPFAIMLVIIFIYLVLGMFIDALAMILLTIPIFYPVVVNVLGYDPIWFGVIIVLVGGMGNITPPVGMNVYIIKGVTKDVELEQIFNGVWPFVFAIISCILILIAFPSLVTFFV